ncbi:hypothetical protein HCN44_005254 [Aphidius gifuensis]|uniref:Uncharacterized protein n=1 Tax=Aphidius gifuensis TaxID=684658 RepID=A0A835CV07_APHGI|nr:hypothetical protein HCN44_005254 [Aphidius gifuensis]
MTTPSNQQNVLLAPMNIVSTTVSSKQNDWWPVIEQEIIHSSQHKPDIQQSILPTFYMSVPSTLPPYYRSDNWTPYGHPEHVFPVMSESNNNQVIQLPLKYLSIGLFIGLLTLFAIIQSSIMTISKQKKENTIDDLSDRKKRDVHSSKDFYHMTPEQQEIFLNDAKIRCIQKTICEENRQLVNDLGLSGIKLAKYLMRSVKNSLKTTSGWDKLVDDAGEAGLRGDDCNVLYRDCQFPAISQIS